MLRNCSLEEISDGKLYTSNDMVKAGCNNCEGCSKCCQGMGNSIVLDPLDVYRLMLATDKTFEELMESSIELNVVDGMILPNIKMVNEACSFLDDNGRCSIHSDRPGICRLFPLGRYYEGDEFKYILQIHECERAGKVKVKVSKWLDTPYLKKYEKYILDWHTFIKKIQDLIAGSDEHEQTKQLSLIILNELYIKKYNAKKDDYEGFYKEFYERLDKISKIFNAIN